jgi:hypothetical protein
MEKFRQLFEGMGEPKYKDIKAGYDVMTKQDIEMLEKKAGGKVEDIGDSETVKAGDKFYNIIKKKDVYQAQVNYILDWGGDLFSNLSDFFGDKLIKKMFDELGADALDKKNLVKQAKIYVKERFNDKDYPDDYDYSSLKAFVKDYYDMDIKDLNDPYKVYDNEILYLGQGSSNLDEIIDNLKFVGFDYDNILKYFIKDVVKKPEEMLSDYREVVPLKTVNAYRVDY